MRSEWNESVTYLICCVKIALLLRGIFCISLTILCVAIVVVLDIIHEVPLIAVVDYYVWRNLRVIWSCCILGATLSILMTAALLLLP